MSFTCQIIRPPQHVTCPPTYGACVALEFKSTEITILPPNEIVSTRPFSIGSLGAPHSKILITHKEPLLSKMIKRELMKILDITESQIIIVDNREAAFSVYMENESDIGLMIANYGSDPYSLVERNGARLHNDMRDAGYEGLFFLITAGTWTPDETLKRHPLTAFSPMEQFVSTLKRYVKLKVGV